MSGIRFTDEFKRDAVAQVAQVAQVVDRGCSVAEVSERLGISTKLLYTWKAQFSQPRKQIIKATEQAAEIRRLKKELAHVSEERDILKKATVRRPAGEWHIRGEGTSPRMQSEVRVYG